MKRVRNEIFRQTNYFDRYKDHSEPEKIGMEGVVKFLEDLQLDPKLDDDPVDLPCGWHPRVIEQTCEFGKLELVSVTRLIWSSHAAKQ